MQPCPIALHWATPTSSSSPRTRRRRWSDRPELADLNAEDSAGRVRVTILADLVVFLGATTAEAITASRDSTRCSAHALRSDAAVFVVHRQSWPTSCGLGGAGVTGFGSDRRALPYDLRFICHELVAELQRRSIFPPSYETGSLRARLGLGRPANRYATVGWSA